VSLTPREDVEIPEAALAQIEADAQQAVHIAKNAASRAGGDAYAIVGPLAAAILEKIDYARGREYTRVNQRELATNAARKYGDG
jgi:hypothetical protein